MTGIFIRKHEGTPTRGKYHVMEAENESYAATNQGTPKTAGNYQKQGEKHETDSLSEIPRKNQPCLQLDFRLPASRTVRE